MEALGLVVVAVELGLRRARLHLMNSRAQEGIAALEKLRADLLLYARDAV